MRKIPAVGSKKRGDGEREYENGKRRVVCILNDDMFMEVRKRAVKKGISFAEQVRLLIKWGLEA